jgi:peptidoglycan/xylan/chitin deacetylase (PgdA/CDA1 family)
VVRRLQSWGRRAAIRAYALTVTAGGVDRRRLRQLAGSGGLIVLNLHNVGPARGRFTRPIPPGVFDQLVGWLDRECHLTTFDRLGAPDQAGRRPRAILSFDDGYRDFMEYAMPVLERHGVRANENILPGCVESGRPPWNVELLDALERVPLALLRSLRLPSEELSRPPADESDLMRWGVKLSRLLKLRPRDEREPLLKDLMVQLQEGMEGEAQAMMTAKDVVEAARIHEIGVHSYAHDSMEFETDDFFSADLHRCRTWYQEHLAADPRVYAFPNGSYRDSQAAIARRTGIQHLLSVGERTASAEAAIHPRVTADGVTLRELRMRIARAF